MDYKSYKIIETKCKRSIKNNQKAEGKSMKNQRTKCKGIKSKWIAWKLRKEGFQIATVEPDWHNPEKDIYLGENIWIGCNTTILKGTSLKRDIIIGAGSVVATKINEVGVVLAGNPARIIKKDVTWGGFY